MISPLERLPGVVDREALPLLRSAFAADPSDHTLDDLIAMSFATIRGLAILPLVDPRDHHTGELWALSRTQLTELFERRSAARSKRNK